MKLLRHICLLFLLLLVASCKTKAPNESPVAPWPGAQVFKMPSWTFMSESLELKDGRFRYWFSSDTFHLRSPKYPIVGNYSWQGDELVLSSGKTFQTRQVNAKTILLWPHAVEDWDRRQIIPGHLLLPVQSIDSEPPELDAVFTQAQMDQSAKNVKQLGPSK